ncbi:MAG TPA: hypothetical protein DEQ86_01270 [Candidatus Jacksonbacteria bacterium]|nr:hypothetical protein [Candidatus Jacksonbacteria bacterium]HCE48807.1 hypothetical protein [Candidatus Jacksonbacteria bacterium]HCR15596.1 hypothetical protein [Candidatus Jacksonbacteria bacterium]
MAKTDSYKEVFIILARNRLVDLKLSENLQQLAAFRNELVHEYLILNHQQIFDIWQHNLLALDQFLTVVSELVKK